MSRVTEEEVKTQDWSVWIEVYFYVQRFIFLVCSERDNVGTDGCFSTLTYPRFKDPEQPDMLCFVIEFCLHARTNEL